MSEGAKRALIVGVSGQDGAYLAAALHGHGLEVAGTSRGGGGKPIPNLERLGLSPHVRVFSLEPSDLEGVRALLSEFAPDQVYFLSAQSSVGKSFDVPMETFESIVRGTLCLLEAARLERPSCRLYFASSGDCFGDTGERPADEETAVKPVSPYGAARAAALHAVRVYREAYGLHACNGISFSHESPLRPAHFVVQKIAEGAARIAAGRQRTLELGALDIVRDWGWAPEYVEAMRKAIDGPVPRDYVLATGRSVSLEHLVQCAFGHFGLDWRRHVEIGKASGRPSDIKVSRANPARADRELGWRAAVSAEEVMVRMCVAAEGASAS